MITFHLNGEETQTDCRPDKTVLEFLRERGLRGTKEGCAEGDCGACSLLLSRPDKSSKKPIWQPVNSCILLMGQLSGSSIFTIEGLSSLSRDSGHTIQRIMASNGSSQCGFCTPGIAISLAGLLSHTPRPTSSQIHDALAGNLCRCTGYRPIVEAVHKATGVKATSGKAENLPSPPTRTKSISASIGTSSCTFHQPKTLKDLIACRTRHPKAILLGGGTDLCLPVAQAKERWSHIITTRHIPQLRKIEKTRDFLKIGAAITLQEFLPIAESHWQSLGVLLRRFGSTQIRTTATLAGNLATASPIGDLAPCLISLGAHLILLGKRGERKVKISDFFRSYRESVLRPDEIIRSIIIPLPHKNDIFQVYKISKRYDQDISTLCGAFRLRLNRGIVHNCNISFGGMSACPQSCPPAEQALLNRPFDMDSVSLAKDAVSQFFTPLDDVRSTSSYRLSVACNLLDRLYHSIHTKGSLEVMDL